MMAGWLLVCLGMSAMVTGWVMARDAQAGTLAAGNAAMTALGPSTDLIRVHVIANSDSTQDQTVKVKVRNAVMEHLTPRLAGATSQAEAEAVIAETLPQLEAIADRVIDTHGLGYGVGAELGIFAFPGKSYGDLYLPAGDYKALRIVIGDGQGANFWCLLYPSFCYELAEVQGDSSGTVGPEGGSTTDNIW